MFAVITVISGLLTLQAGKALATGDAYFPQDTTVSIGGLNFLIEAGSDADEVIATNTNITITISAGQRLTFSSSEGKTMVISGGNFALICAGDKSYVLLAPSSGTYTVIITPDTTAGVTCGGGGGGGPSGGTTIVSTTTPAPTPSPTTIITVTSPSPSATPSPSTSVGSLRKPSEFGLKNGDVISAAGSSDPDVYIVNDWGYKRLFLNQAIFAFYGHLGGFSKVKRAAVATRDAFVTSGLFRNCETNDPKVYAVEVTGEDTGILHWVNVSGEIAVSQDPNFFKKVFCINNNEFNWYPKGAAYTSLSQVPVYTRGIVQGVQTSTLRLRIIGAVSWVNVRSGSSTKTVIVGKAIPGEEYAYTDVQNGWYKIQRNGKDFGWVYGLYVKKL